METKHTKESVTGRIENWYAIQSSKREFIIYGAIYDDINRRFEDGAIIHTSGIKNRSVKSGDIVKTRNSTYLLGNKI